MQNYAQIAGICYYAAMQEISTTIKREWIKLVDDKMPLVKKPVLLSRRSFLRNRVFYFQNILVSWFVYSIRAEYPSL